MKSDIKKVLQFVTLIDQFKNIQRQIHKGGGHLENDAEHAWHLSMMVWLFASFYEKKVDLEKCLKMAIAHDLIEIYAGDVFTFDQKGREGKHEREQKAAQKLFGSLPKKLSKELTEIWEEFENKGTPEAHYVQALDKLQPIVQNIVVKGKSWKDFKITEQMVRDHKTHYNKGSDLLMSIFEDLLKEACKKKFF
jgi:putative hydrolases of HD superfamily